METCAKSSEGRELILPATGGVLQNDVVIPGESHGLSLSLSHEGLHIRGADTKTSGTSTAACTRP